MTNEMIATQFVFQLEDDRIFIKDIHSLESRAVLTAADALLLLRWLGEQRDELSRLVQKGVHTHLRLDMNIRTVEHHLSECSVCRAITQQDPKRVEQLDSRMLAQECEMTPARVHEIIGGERLAVVESVGRDPEVSHYPHQIEHLLTDLDEQRPF